jgi:hypothetical protein
MIRAASGGFGVSGFHGAARAELSLGQVNDADLFSFSRFRDQDTGATKLNIVGMCADRQYVQLDEVLVHLRLQDSLPGPNIRLIRPCVLVSCCYY